MNTQYTISIAKIRLDHATPMRQVVDKVLGFLLTCNEVKQATRIDSDEFKSWQSKKNKNFQTVAHVAHSFDYDHNQMNQNPCPIPIKQQKIVNMFMCQHFILMFVMIKCTSILEVANLVNGVLIYFL